MTTGHRGKRKAPFSLRLTFEERARLIDTAGAMPLSAYIKSLLFSDDAPRYRKRRSAASADQKLLGELLACLGASRLSSNLNQLAKAANTGTRYFDEDTKAAITRASDDIRVMRLLLMQALGLHVDDQTQPPESLAQRFSRAATDHMRLSP